MQRNLRTAQRRRLRLGVLSLALGSALVIAGCGPLGGDDEEPTATVDTISQPTISDDHAIPASPTSEPPDASRGESTPAVSVATPALPDAGMGDATPVAADQLPDEESETPVSPEDGMTVATPELENGDEPALTGSDGTSGATPDQEALVGSVDDGEATPSDNATPTDAPTVDLQELDPVEVSSCNPESIPPFASEQAEYLTVIDVNFRAGPGEDCDQIGEGPIGVNSAVAVLSNPVVRGDDETFAWVQVQIVNQIGWIVVDAIEPAP